MQYTCWYIHELTSTIGTHLWAVTLRLSKFLSWMYFILPMTNSDTPNISEVRHKPANHNCMSILFSSIHYKILVDGLMKGEHTTKVGSLVNEGGDKDQLSWARSLTDVVLLWVLLRQHASPWLYLLLHISLCCLLILPSSYTHTTLLSVQSFPSIVQSYVNVLHYTLVTTKEDVVKSEGDQPVATLYCTVAYLQVFTIQHL